MRTMTIRLIGATPLLLHQVARHQLRDRITSHVENGISLEKETEANMSRDVSGNPAVPAEWIWDSLRGACKQVLVEGKQLSFIKLESQIIISSETLHLQTKTCEPLSWTVYRSVQHAAPGSKRSIAVIAPQFSDWMIELDVGFDPEKLDENLFQRIWREAGRVGIGLFHPPKKHFGQFLFLVKHAGA